jgi:hypothetical protein
MGGKGLRQARSDVDADGRVATLARVVEVTPQPAIGKILVLVTGGLPDFRRTKMAAIRVWVANAVDDRKMSGIEEIFEASQARIQSKRVVQRQHLSGWNPNRGARLVVIIIGVGHHGVEAIVAACELDKHENGAIFARGCLDQGAVGFGMQCVESLCDKTGHRPTKCSAQKRSAKEIAASGKEGIVHGRGWLEGN